VKRLLAPTAALALLLAMAGVALAWTAPALSAECAPDGSHFAWKIHLPSESNYNIDWSFDSGFATFSTINFGSSGDHDFTTDRGGTTLYVRWSSDTGVKAHAAADDSLCQQPSVEESVAESTAASVEESVAESTAESVAEQTVEAGTGTPAATIPNTSLDGTGSGPLPTIVFSVVLLGSLGILAYGNVKLARAPHRTR
jgi:hypothetical protein